MKMLMNSNEYLQIIETIKGQIKGAQYQAALNVNRELIMLYYHIGKVINEHKTWGSKFIENLAADIRISRMSRVIPCATSNTWQNSRRLILMKHLCRRCLHKFRGRIIPLFWTR